MMFRRLPDETVQEHINIFLKAPHSIYIGHIASASVLLYMASKNPAVPIWFLYLWGFLEIICYPSAMEIWTRLYKRTRPSKRDNYRWIAYMDAICLIVGFSWGTMLFVSLTPTDAPGFAIQMSITAGATAAAVRSLAAFPRTFTLYAVPFLGLVALRLFTLGEDYALLGGLVLVFLLMLLMSGRDVMETVSQYIAIRNENLDLAERFRGAAAEAEHANREKTRLLAAASHDLRQPIHAIGLYMETLSIDRMEEKSRQTLSRIRNSLNTLSKLFNSLLDVSLLDSGKIQVKTSIFDLQEMLNHILDDYEPLAEIAHVTLVLECPKLGASGDPVLIRRMVQNLLSNAIRYSDGGTVTIRGEQEGEHIRILVKDEGPGIAKEHQQLIFEEFTQISSRSDRIQSEKKQGAQPEKGLGLGLAIVRRLADLQDLTLGMESSSKGTCLQISGLKTAKLVDQKSALQSPMDRIGALFRQKHILVADDDRETLEATASLLAKWGVQCQ